MKQSPEATEQSETGKLWPLCFILLPILGLLLYKRKYLCGKMQLLRTCCHKTNEAATESEQEMSGYFHQARREETGTVHVKAEFEAGQIVREEFETENDIYISADHFQRSEAGQIVREEFETENDIYISADNFQRGEAEEYETVNDIYVSADVHHFGSEEYETVNDIHVSNDC
ncbi:uncharacterized protein LOC134775927 isoform X1 [Penaeus indicus]|uniref:uncharacterized protein LOC134775927 isoform X1 n=1 Tax=Penaeus indicus TaxID=29960 RepID=UPI00300D0B55